MHVTEANTTSRWAARPVQAALVRAVAFLTPIAGSILFVHYASTVVAVPTSSFALFITWWVLMSASATVVLIAIDRVARRLLPLVALYKLSLVFPDAAPSRFRLAMRANTVESLERRVAAKASTTPVEAAERLLALVSELDSHDRLTRGHSERVRAYAQLIAAELHLGQHERELLNWAALLHDVGKLEVPAEILTKPGKPTAAEWAVLRRHPEMGEKLVAPLREWLGEWTDAVGQHHERWDGAGYPHGISGDDIALAGRIVAVADVFDVITSARSYKEPFASTVARNEIANGASTQFDPRVVRAFLNISLRRLRRVMGPLSWLAHAPILGRLPLTPAIGTLSGSLATVVAAVSTGLVSPPAPALGTALSPARATLPAMSRVTREDESITVSLGAARRGHVPTSLRVTVPPAVGRARVTSGRALLYTPPPNYHGAVTIGYEGCWSPRDCGSGAVVITVVPVNDPPDARDDIAYTRPGTPVSIDVLANDTDPDGNPITLVGVSGLTAGRATIAGGRVLWASPKKALRVATFTYSVTDGNGGRASAQVTVNVSRWNPPPPAPPPATTGGSHPQPPPSTSPAPALPPGTVPPSDQAPRAVDDVVSVPEGGTVTLDALANDSDPDGDALRLVSVDPAARGRATKVGDRIQFVAPSDYVGRVRFSYTTADPQGATSRAFVSVTVLLVNVAPSFAAGPNQSVLEDAGPQTVTGWASRISPGPSSESGQAITFDVSTADSSLFTPGGQPVVTPDGALTFTPAPNANGSATVSVLARDDGGRANGGVDTSVTKTVTISVVPVNDAPSFQPGGDRSVLEDAGPQSVSSWATEISPGPPNESGQAVSFDLSNGNPGLFAPGGQPRVSAAGTLNFTAAPNASGAATVTVRAKDDGGTANGGVGTSPSQSFTIAVGPANDAPMFAKGADQSVPEDSGPQSVPGWASAVAAGPPNESGQNVSFLVSTTNPSLFASGGQPSVAPDGTLAYTSAPDASGTATVTVRAKDDGGTANGGVDTSAAQTFTIAISPVNDPPLAVPDAVTAAEDDPAGVTFNVLTNDTDVDTGDVLSVASFDASTIANGTLASNGGGSFTYVPDSGYIGVETFGYVASDGNGGTANGTVTITVTPVQHAPIAGNDAYTTAQDTTLTVSAPGVLANDGDQDGDTLTLQTTPVAAPSNGTVALAADGSFTYTPNAGFTGPDSFTYRVDDGTGRSADGVVTITVSASAPTSSTLYFQSSGPSADVWDLTTSPPPSAPQLADFDGDGKPGLTIKNSDGKETITEGNKYQTWTYPLVAPLLLTGPVTLDLWSSTGLFGTLKPGTIYTYLYDCTTGGSSCTKIAQNAVVANPWNASLIDWSYRTIVIGTVNRTIPTGNELRVKVLFHPSDLWLTMTAAYPSALVVTLG